MSSKVSLIIAILIIIGMMLLLFGLHLPDNARFFREIQNLGHIPIFGLLSIALLIILDRLLSRFNLGRLYLYLASGVLTVFLGGLVEIIQYFGPRDADPYDFMLDIAGAIIFLGFYSTLDSKNRQFWRKYKPVLRRLVQIFITLFALLLVLPQIRLGVAYIERNNSFPVIASFESWWESEFINMQDAGLEKAEIPSGWSGNNSGKAGLITFYKAQYPGISFYETYPDWSGYESLGIEVYSKLNDTIRLAVRIDDIHHDCTYEDRFTGGFEIYPGENRIEIPLEVVQNAPRGREMDMHNIVHLLLFMVDTQETYKLYFDNIRLIK